LLTEENQNATVSERNIGSTTGNRTLNFKGALFALIARAFDLVPMVFDFDRPTDKDYTETIQTLAGMSMFVMQM
jgi:hypothetical protein